MVYPLMPWWVFWHTLFTKLANVLQVHLMPDWHWGKSDNADRKLEWFHPSVVWYIWCTSSLVSLRLFWQPLDTDARLAMMIASWLCHNDSTPGQWSVVWYLWCTSWPASLRLFWRRLTLMQGWQWWSQVDYITIIPPLGNGHFLMFIAQKLISILEVVLTPSECWCKSDKCWSLLSRPTILMLQMAD
jgi:hypothetical protein